MPAYRRLAITYGTGARFLRVWLLRPQMPFPVAVEIDARLTRRLQRATRANIRPASRLDKNKC